MFRGHLCHARKRKHALRVQGMFCPKGAVLIKRGYAVTRLNVFGAGFFGCVFYEDKD
jgi:hypothetical protein